MHVVQVKVVSQGCESSAVSVKFFFCGYGYAILVIIIITLRFIPHGNTIADRTVKNKY